MELLLIRSKWDMPDLPLHPFVERLKAAGFNGAEIHFERAPLDPQEIAEAFRDHGMHLVAMITTEGTTAEDHMASFAEKLRYVRDVNPLQVNCHTGKDYFPLRENIKLLAKALELSRDSGLSVSHETHRGRATYSAPATGELLNALPDLTLTADFSHWCCVHESLLENQPEALQLAIERTAYIHARVGHIEGPQVSDPRAPEWHKEVQTHMGWWRRIAAAQRERGASFLAICPEFGPTPYMPTLPYTRQPVADLWEITVYMKNLIRSKIEETVA
jgi:sugar phosphate isomerase/epimerase